MRSSPDLDAYERRVLDGWEEIYKRGLLTMWLLLAVSERARYAAEIAAFLAERTGGTITADIRSLYRALRRLADVGLVQDEGRPAERSGADRKYFSLTKSGERVLNVFLERNVRAVYVDRNADLFGRTGTDAVVT
jgi:DNA-binding PadR family transcriptional regulator